MRPLMETSRKRSLSSNAGFLIAENVRHETDAMAAPLHARYKAARQMSEQLARPLTSEDCQIQSMPDASPTKWHLAHTTWFFETFVLAIHAPGFSTFDPSFNFLF